MTTDKAAVTSHWERNFDTVTAWVPYVTLAIGTGLAVLDLPRQRLFPTLGLAALAAGWVYVMFTRVGDFTRRQPWARLYFTGLILLAAGLMAYHGAFFAFAITGFVHAILLRPTPLVFVGVALTSLVINSRIVYPDPTSDGWWVFGIVVVVQTLAIGFGVVGGEKLTELSEQRRQTVIQLESALEENAGLHAQLVAQAREAGITDERQRLAHEIHDTIAQGLIGVITQLEAASQVKADPQKLERRLDNAIGLARDSLTEARRSVSALVPVPLEGRRLPEAIADVAARWSSMSGVPATVTTTGDPQALHPEVEVTVLRVAQEGLANVAKHAIASRVGLTLSYMGDVVTIDVRDDGAGFAPMELNGTRPRSGFGLTAMRQRVEGLSGTLDVESEPGLGTAISASLPAITVGPDGD